MLSVYCPKTKAQTEINPENYSDIFKFPLGSEIHLVCGMYDLAQEFVLGHEKHGPPTESPFFLTEGVWALYTDPADY